MNIVVCVKQVPEVADAWSHRDRKVDFPGRSRDASGGGA